MILLAIKFIILSRKTDILPEISLLIVGFVR